MNELEPHTSVSYSRRISKKHGRGFIGHWQKETLISLILRTLIVETWSAGLQGEVGLKCTQAKLTLYWSFCWRYCSSIWQTLHGRCHDRDQRIFDTTATVDFNKNDRPMNQRGYQLWRKRSGAPVTRRRFKYRSQECAQDNGWHTLSTLGHSDLS